MRSSCVGGHRNTSAERLPRSCLRRSPAHYQSTSRSLGSTELSQPRATEIDPVALRRVRDANQGLTTGRATDDVPIAVMYNTIAPIGPTASQMVQITSAVVISKAKIC